MDWKALKNKALDLSVKAMSASAKALEKWKEMAEKAKEKWEEIADKAKEVSSDVINKAEDIKDKALEKKDDMFEKVSEVKENITEKKEEIQDKISSIKENAEEKIDQQKWKWVSFLDKAKNMWAKALESTTQVVGKAAPVIKIISDYEKVKEDKILAILFLQKDDENSKFFQLNMPLILKDVWINWATFRVVDISDSKDVADNFDVEKIPTLIVFEKGEEKARYEDMTDIKRYLKDFTV